MILGITPIYKGNYQEGTELLNQALDLAKPMNNPTIEKMVDQNLLSRKTSPESS